MATNREVITTALRMLGVIDAHSSASAEDAALGLTELNDLMEDLSGEGIDLGYPPQDNVSEDFPLDDNVTAAVKPLLAMYLMVHFPSQQVPDALPIRAANAMKRLQRRAVLGTMEEASLTNMPLGETSPGVYNILTDE
jgi:hypothetical protein